MFPERRTPNTERPDPGTRYVARRPDPTPGPELTLEWGDPYRNERIWKWLQPKDHLTQQQMLTLQTDVYSELDQEIAQRLAYGIDHASHADARLRQAADLLRSWDGAVTIDSAACRHCRLREARLLPDAPASRNSATTGVSTTGPSPTSPPSRS